MDLPKITHCYGAVARPLTRSIVREVPDSTCGWQFPLTPTSMGFPLNSCG
jgi:hypothetical protein